MSSVIIAGDTSGTVTLQAPSVAGSTVLTLPATNGTVLTNKTAGTILQVVQGTYASGASNSLTTYADTNLTATITPSSATNKILVMVTHNGVSKNVGSASSGVALKLVRNSTDLSIFARYLGYTGSSSYNVGFSCAVNYLDSPATTSAVTYKTQFANETNAASVEINANGAISYITLMEIAV